MVAAPVVDPEAYPVAAREEPPRQPLREAVVYVVAALVVPLVAAREEPPRKPLREEVV